MQPRGLQALWKNRIYFMCFGCLKVIYCLHPVIICANSLCTSHKLSGKLKIFLTCFRFVGKKEERIYSLFLRSCHSLGIYLGIIDMVSCFGVLHSFLFCNCFGLCVWRNLKCSLISASTAISQPSKRPSYSLLHFTHPPNTDTSL